MTCNLKPEKLVHSNQEHEKKSFPAILMWKKLVPSCFEPEKHQLQLLGERKKQIPAIRRLKNVVHNCQKHGNRL